MRHVHLAKDTAVDHGKEIQITFYYADAVH